MAKKEPRARRPDGAGTWQFPSDPTPGATNEFSVPTDIVINEIMYHPPAVSGPDGAAQDPLEWLELFNRGAQPVDLSGYQLVDAVEYAFPKGTSIALGVNNLTDVYPNFVPAANNGPSGAALL